MCRISSVFVNRWRCIESVAQPLNFFFTFFQAILFAENFILFIWSVFVLVSHENNHKSENHGNAFRKTRRCWSLAKIFVSLSQQFLLPVSKVRRSWSCHVPIIQDNAEYDTRIYQNQYVHIRVRTSICLAWSSCCVQCVQCVQCYAI